MKDGRTNIAPIMVNRQRVSAHRVVIACDVHSANTYVYAVDTQTGLILVDRYVLGSCKELEKALGKKIASAKLQPQETVVLYEAGSAGFSLYRRLSAKGYQCKVVVPNSVPKQFGKKTDRLDAVALFNYFISGHLRFVWIPTPEMESARELLRYRFRLQWDCTAEKQKVQSLLRRHGLEFTETKSSWTKKHWIWLKTVNVSTEIRIVLDLHLEKIETCQENIAKMDGHIDKMIARNEQLSRLYNAYMTITGIGPVGARTWIFEGQDLRRFKHPTSLMNYIGVVPMKFSSGTKDPSLKITKAGNKYLRYVTVVAAKCYTDRRLQQKKMDIRCYPAALAELVSNSQERLSLKYQRLRERAKNSNKAKVAIARELCAYIWELVVKTMPQIEPQYFNSAA